MTAVKVADLHKSYGSVRALQGVSFSVDEGEIFGILGPNGAGKTTTVEIIEGLTKPDSGSVSVFGLDPDRDRTKLRNVLGAQLQQSRLPEKIRVWEALHLYSSFYDDPEPVDSLIELVGLSEKRKSYFENLSGGQQQRLSIALALVGRPRVAILDELTTGLDPAARRSVWESVLDLRARGLTVILVTHFMEEAERLCDRLALVNEGRIIALDTPRGIIERSGHGQTVTFTTREPVPADRLSALPEVSSVSVDGDRVTIQGGDEVLAAVTGALHGAGISPQQLRVHQATLDDAFLKLAQHRLQDGEGEDQ